MKKTIINTSNYSVYVVEECAKDLFVTDAFKEIIGETVIEIDKESYFCPATEKFYGLIPKECLNYKGSKRKKVEAWGAGNFALLKKDAEELDVHGIGLTEEMRDRIRESIPVQIINADINYSNDYILYLFSDLEGENEFKFYATEEMFTVISEEEKDKLLEQKRKEKEKAEAERKKVLAELGIDVRDRLARELAKALDKREYCYDIKALTKIVEEWWIAKRDLIKLLSKHPQWNEEKFLIQFDTDTKRERNSQAINDFIFWVLEKIDCLDKIEEFDSTQYCELRDMTYRLANMGKADGKMTSEDKDMFSVETLKFALLRPNEREIVSDKDIKKSLPRVGQKLSRWVNKIFTTYFPEIVEAPDYEQEFAKFADAVNPLMVKRHTCLSLNPVDFLLQSYGNSWRSCHYIGNYPDDAGCYCSGTISYMLDETSMVFYTVDGDYNGDEIEHEAKITRNMFAWKNGALLQQRIYPQNTDGNSEIYVRYRKVVQSIFAQVLEQPNMWSTNHNARMYCRRGVGSTMYHDWREQETSLSAISILNSFGYINKDENKIVIGAEPIDICSGRRHGDTSNICPDLTKWRRGNCA